MKSSVEVAKRATPSGTPSGDNGNCNTGPVQCCNQVSQANDNVVTAILSLLGIEGIADDVLVGLQCSPLSVAGVGSGSTWYVPTRDACGLTSFLALTSPFVRTKIAPSAPCAVRTTVRAA